ncbi:MULTISPECIES: aspartate-alanine antiporter [unclassified Cupriavidus]|uniref:aspartate-alanine antiporter n=1 Tax=unclassified Cupriavidus TaxID=2640874 RepID=UPI001BFFFC87|nr:MULTISPECIES: aspartate-alanine antiporter [unclassified Cupriavidus]MCA3182078.1 aspartate-alanine antiporter [Cupriavidus sp.]MCA3191074.1 aspartate-alanine antiporter [Cupriavidus sp.]MCA3195132.1 aspartate-alanine antiporter [Cupriavidus sp.]MCA3204102.1 aspartate-alanine antiporter [Cupriavidus sp.]MCA3209319.1 aspartate-alanine antiporter [Cupriavidus sp.]
MDWLHAIFQKSPESALFLSLAVGYALGKITFGKFQLGGVAGSLLAAVIISQVGVEIDNGVKAVMFAVFIYAVGYESGPQFFNSLNRSSLREIAMAVFMAVAGLVTVVVLAKIFHLDKGIAAGLAAGGMTQSAIIGTAGDAITKLGLPPDQVKTLQANVAIGYAVTYVFGSLGAIIVCVNILPRLMGTDLKTDAKKVEASMHRGLPQFGPGQAGALPRLVGRLFRVTGAAGKTVKDIEVGGEDLVTVEKLQRGGKPLDVTQDTVLEAGDIVLLVGRRDAMVPTALVIGEEVADAEGMGMVMQTRRAVFTRKGLNNKPLGEIVAGIDREMRHGVYLERIERSDHPLPILPDLKLQHGDIITFYGTPADTKRAAQRAGYELVPSEKTDFVYFGAGVLVGLLIGLLVVRIGSIPLTLGAGGGALLSGLVFGWARSKHPMYGAMPTAACQLLKDFGLAAFVAIVGINSGLQAVDTLRHSGLTIFLLGAVVTLLPLFLTMLFGRYVLKYDNAALLAGALAGSRSANPAFGGILDKAESPVPTVPFAITYALANVLLTLLGPLVVGFV